MKFLFAFLVSLAIFASAEARDEKVYRQAFSKFIAKHKKQYEHSQFFHRYQIFRQNMQHILDHNESAKHTYTLAVNEFADLTGEEFKALYTGYKPIDRSYLRGLNTVELDTTALPTALDWTTTNNPKNMVAVTAVKNQQQCGSCWAFSTTGSVEGAWAIAGNPIVSLSEQQLVDCSSAQGNQGCNGGLMDQAFQYIISNGGITSETQYPYVATQNPSCNTQVTSVAHISSYQDVPQNQPDQLAAYANKGPVSVAIEADQSVFQFYSGGVINDPSCGTQLDHGVLVVGYGFDSTANTQYFKVKNSWGASWGENGYVRIARGASNICGINSMPSQPYV